MLSIATTRFIPWPRRLRQLMAVIAALVGSAALGGCYNVPDPTPTTRFVPTMMTEPVSRTTTSYGPDPAQVLDVLDSPAPGSMRPVIVYVHGGAFRGGSRTDVQPLLKGALKWGYVVVSIDYRVAPAVRFPEPVRDVHRAVRWVQANATTLRVDPNKVIVWGHSAGGTLAAHAALSWRDPAFRPKGLPTALARQSGRIRGFVNESGPMDLAAWARNPSGFDGTPAEAVGAYVNCPASGTTLACPAATLAAASPISAATADDPPGYNLYGAKDVLVNSSQGSDFVIALGKIIPMGDAWWDLADTGPETCQGHLPDYCANASELQEFLGLSLLNTRS